MTNQLSNDFEFPHYQIQFFSTDSRYQDLPTDVINIPASAGSEQLNLLIKAAQDADGVLKTVIFDFLVNGLLLRTTLLEHVETYQVSVESIVRIECIQLEPPPVPKQDLPDSEWIADVKTLPNCLFSVNYGGELILWTGAEELRKTVVKKLDNDPLKCLATFDLDGEKHVIVGGQDQALTLLKMTTTSHNKELELATLAVFRGHQRSVECVAVNSDGSRAVSGSFDRCLKVWRTKQSDYDIDADDTYVPSGRNKKAKSLLVTRTPMVTLESHREAIVGVKWNPLNTGQAVTVSWDHTIMTWDLEMAASIQTLNFNKAFTSLSLNQISGLVLTGSTDPVVRLWDLRSKEGSLVKNTFLGHLGWVSDLCWAPDVDHLFVTAGFDNTVKMWDIRSSKAALYDLMGHQDRVLAVDWSISKIIASGSADSTIKLFSR